MQPAAMLATAALNAMDYHCLDQRADRVPRANRLARGEVFVFSHRSLLELWRASPHHFDTLHGTGERLSRKHCRKALVRRLLPCRACRRATTSALGGAQSGSISCKFPASRSPTTSHSLRTITPIPARAHCRTISPSLLDITGLIRTVTLSELILEKRQSVTSSLFSRSARHLCAERSLG